MPLDPKKPVNTFWDIGKDDNTAIWFYQSHGGTPISPITMKTTGQASRSMPASFAKRGTSAAGNTASI
jgi:hypothetical protein